MNAMNPWREDFGDAVPRGTPRAGYRRRSRLLSQIEQELTDRPHDTPEIRGRHGDGAERQARAAESAAGDSGPDQAECADAT